MTNISKSCIRAKAEVVANIWDVHYGIHQKIKIRPHTSREIICFLQARHKLS